MYLSGTENAPLIVPYTYTGDSSSVVKELQTLGTSAHNLLVVGVLLKAHHVFNILDKAEVYNTIEVGLTARCVSSRSSTECSIYVTMIRR